VPRSKLSETLQQQVRDRARHLCEFCHACEKWQYVKFTVDHFIPLSLGGSDQFHNLALACFHCNRRKTNRLTAIDPISKADVSLFNPRQETWRDHFKWSEDKLTIVGLTATGRATVIALALNRDRVISIRSADLEVGRHPPMDDLI
jgi:HNH endonuclease